MFVIPMSGKFQNHMFYQKNTQNFFTRFARDILLLKFFARFAREYSKLPSIFFPTPTFAIFLGFFIFFFKKIFARYTRENNTSNFSLALVAKIHLPTPPQCHSFHVLHGGGGGGTTLKPGMYRWLFAPIFCRTHVQKVQVCIKFTYTQPQQTHTNTSMISQKESLNRYV